MTGPQPIFMAAALLGAVGLWLMLPRASAWGRSLGAVLALASLGMLFTLVFGVGHWAANGAFYVLAAVTVVSAAATITMRKPVYSAVWFALTLLGTAGLFLLQGAQFLAVATVVVYAGAILVTFLFVLMLADPRGRAPYDRVSWEAMVSAASGAVLVGMLSMTLTGVLRAEDLPPPPKPKELQAGVLAKEHVARVGAELLGGHLIAVEVAGTLLLAALVGAAVIVGRSRPMLQEPESVRPETTADREGGRR